MGNLRGAQSGSSNPPSKAAVAVHCCGGDSAAGACDACGANITGGGRSDAELDRDMLELENVLGGSSLVIGLSGRFNAL